MVKAMLLVAYLDQPSARDRALTQDDRRILGPMIRVSDNDDAQIVFAPSVRAAFVRSLIGSG